MTNLANFQIKIFKEEDGTFFGEVLNLPGCFSFGETLEELNQNLKEAISSYLGSIEKDLKTFNFNITNKDIINTKITKKTLKDFDINLNAKDFLKVLEKKVLKK